MDFEKTAQTLLFLGLINEDKMKATPRIHFPEIHSEINILSQKYSEINVLPPILRLNLFPEMYSENKFTSPKYIPRGANERKHFQLCCKYFPRVLQKHLIDQEGGGVLKRRTQHGTVRRCSHDFDDFDVGQIETFRRF